jgi:hypothetical protein
MRTITIGQIAVFGMLVLLAIVASSITTVALPARLPLADFRGVALVVFWSVFFFLYMLLAYRLFLAIAPLKEGVVRKGSREEFVYFVYELFYLTMFHSFTRSHFVPVPLMRLIYTGLGARFGRNSYSAGTLLDPPLTTMGDNCIVGHDAVLFCHVVEGDELSLQRIRLGHNVTIGARAIVMPGVVIGDNAIVAVGAVVTKGTWIADNERWGGIPARRLGETALGEVDVIAGQAARSP